MEPEAVTDALARGRASYAARSWGDAYDALSLADRSGPLEATDVELLAVSAYMLGRDDEWLTGFERAYHLFIDGGDGRRAVRCALWIGIDHMLRGKVGQATAWLGRAERLLEREPDDCVERGYALIPRIFRHEATGEWRTAAEVAGQAAETGERFGEPDLVALGRQAQGALLATNGEAAEGLALVDEAMLTLTTSDVSPIVAGLVYCGVILACREAYDVRRAREWTDALSRWCDEQPDLVAFTGRCLVHRAEIMQLGGQWRKALTEATRAGERLVAGFNQGAAAEAFYRQGELRRVSGELDAAESCYREAARLGREPQPGLALLRQALGRGDLAVAAIRRVLGETPEPYRRAELLGAAVELYLAENDVDAARAAQNELEELIAGSASELLRGAAAHAHGAVELAAGDASAALVSLRQAIATWQQLGAPYEEARSRELVGRACRALGDEDSAAIELDTALGIFAELGAAVDVERLGALRRGEPVPDRRGLSERELQVLRLVATGRTNREIADELVVSSRTIDRHVSNIFAKLSVASRAAATAYAYEHDLVRVRPG